MKKISGYELEEELGSNSWGTAYRARQVSLDRPVYLTILSPERLTGSAEMFAKSCAGITHPHLVSGIDLGEEEGVRYLVTEWVEGPSVGDLVRRGGAMAEERALEITLAVAQGIDHAARKGLVHGNLSPEAIVIASGGNPKIRGFGADRESVLSDRDYRSPEQKRGEATDIRSDIYSLGLVLHFLVGGEYPFDGAPPAEVVGSEVVERPALLARRISPETTALVELLTAPSRDDRPRDGAVLGEAVEAVIVKLDERVVLRPGRAAKPAARPAAHRTRAARPRRRRRR